MTSSLMENSTGNIGKVTSSLLAFVAFGHGAGWSESIAPFFLVIVLFQVEPEGLLNKN